MSAQAWQYNVSAWETMAASGADASLAHEISATELDAQRRLLTNRLSEALETDTTSDEWLALNKELLDCALMNRDFALLADAALTSIFAEGVSGAAYALDNLSAIVEAHAQILGPARLRKREMALAHFRDDGQATRVLDRLAVGAPTEPAWDAACKAIVHLNATLDAWWRIGNDENNPTKRPKLTRLSTLATDMASGSDRASQGEPSAEVEQGETIMPETSLGTPRTREEASRQLELLVRYFRQSEPSSPVADLLEAARRLVGAPFGRVAELSDTLKMVTDRLLTDDANGSGQDAS